VVQANTVKARAQTDAAFRVALLEEALDAFVNNDLDTGKLLLRDTSMPPSASKPSARSCTRAPRA
jgi:hypothetical protein